jgi:hypothetical protein
MEIRHGSAAWNAAMTCSMNMHERIAWTCMDMRHEYDWKCSLKIQSGHAARTCSRDMLHRSAAWEAWTAWTAWTCRMEYSKAMKHGHAWTTNIDLHGSAAWI